MGNQRRKTKRPSYCHKKFKFSTYEVATAYLPFYPHLRGVHWCCQHECWHLTSQLGVSSTALSVQRVAKDQDDLIQTIAPQLAKWNAA